MYKLLANLQDLKFWLVGKKTNILAAATTLLNLIVVIYPNLLTPAQLLKIDGILVALGGIAIHAAIVRE